MKVLTHARVTPDSLRLSHLRHGVSWVDKMKWLPSPLCSQIIGENTQAQDNPKAELRQTLTLSTGGKTIKYGVSRRRTDVADAS